MRQARSQVSSTKPRALRNSESMSATASDAPGEFDEVALPQEFLEQRAVTRERLDSSSAAERAETPRSFAGWR